MNHFSWKQHIIDINQYKEDLDNLIKNYKKSEYCTYQNNIPEYDLDKLDLDDQNILKDIYTQFFDETGCLILKNVYSEKTMMEYNTWCEYMLNYCKDDENLRHPKQKNKLLINDVIGRMSENDIDLLLSLINNKNLNLITDNLLGFSKIGSCTCHWIEPNGERQLSHVDYPIHLGSGKFWKNDVNNVKKLTTKYQLNKILPYYSLQALIASDQMDIRNGSTEVVPFSHRLPDIDINIHNEEIYNFFEKLFVNVKLNQGDVLLFNRRLCHRGGFNGSSYRRNSLIIQYVWLWGIGQELIDDKNVFKNLEKSEKYTHLSEEEKKYFKLKLKSPYPTDVKKNA